MIPSRQLSGIQSAHLLMKYFFRTVFVFALFVAVGFAPTTQAQEYPWQMDSFDVTVRVQPNGGLEVTEKIDANFFENRHGIIRDIPVKYLGNFGTNYNLRLNINSIKDHKGNDWNYSVSSSGNSKSIKIGDADVYVYGKRTYVVDYGVTGGIKFFEDHDELYWNATGDRWDAPIQTASLTVILPDGSQNVQTVCFTGSFGSTASDCSFTQSSNTVTVKSDTRLLPGQGFTVAVSLDKGVIIPPSVTDEYLRFLSDNWGFLIPVVVFLGLYFHWWRRGRDPKKFHTIVVEFDPPDGLSPAEMGTLLDESADMKDVSAEIIDLAVKKYLTIEEKKSDAWIFSSTDYTLTKTAEVVDPKPLATHQKLLLEKLFKSGDSVKMSSLRESFYVDLAGIQDSLYEDVVEKKKYFLKNPKKVRNYFLGIGSAILFVAFYGIGLFASIERFDLLVGVLLTGPIVMIMSRFMPKKTLAGAEAFRKVLGFKDYINTAEKYRVKFQEDENIFERFLPYAMIFGLADKWAHAFKDIYKGRPEWYKGDGHFSPVVFVGRMNNFAHAANSTLASRPASKGSSSSSGFGGGGFSGGGFGGGGGRSW
jgi:uncharacterized membrane protein